ncbi:MAG: hypothetical protein LBC74_02805 [Planctomycetaceae bacterium]|jgi:hypothetical protein|nr:hypothetical protein [Planctomycetaceae bacterium]
MIKSYSSSAYILNSKDAEIIVTKIVFNFIFKLLTLEISFTAVCLPIGKQAFTLLSYASYRMNSVGYFLMLSKYDEYFDEMM